MTLPAEVVSLIERTRRMLNCNRWQVARQAWEVRELGKANNCEAEAIAELSRLGDRTEETIRDWARTWQLRQELVEELHEPRVLELQETVRITFWSVLAKSYYAGKITPNVVTDMLIHCHEEAQEGGRVTVEQVKDMLPHDEKEVSFLGRARRIIPALIRLFNSPAMGIPDGPYREARKKFMEGWKILQPYVEELYGLPTDKEPF